jgi:hypothetical protein
MQQMASHVPMVRLSHAHAPETHAKTLPMQAQITWSALVPVMMQPPLVATSCTTHMGRHLVSEFGQVEVHQERRSQMHVV